MPTRSAPPPGARGRGDACPGALRLHSAEDGSLARVRVPGGQLTAPQANALGLAAAELGDGNLEFTSRGNVQIRGLAANSGTELGARLHAADLLPSLAHDRVRNIVASPLSGLDGRGHLDVSAWAREVDALLCSSRDLVELSGRFLIGLDDGRGDIASLRADVTVIACPDGNARLRLADIDTAVSVPAAEASHLAVDAAAAFLEVRAELGSDAWRVAELPESAQLIVEKLGSKGKAAASAGDPVRPNPTPPQLGLVHGPEGRSFLSVQSRLGRVTAAQWGAITELAAGAAGSLRITPWRGIVVPHIRPSEAVAALSALDSAGFLTTAASPWAGATACTGRPGCARSLTDVRGDATAALSAAPPGVAGLPVHWSGCERRCGHPTGHHVDVVAAESTYRVGGFGGDNTQIPLDDIADAVASARRTP